MSRASSWVRQGPNDPLEANEVQAAIDDETLASLSQQTGLSREELIARITHGLPQAVDKMTPNGELPVETREPGLLDDAPPYRPKLASRP
ncbi:MAG: YidB family protein [Mesorhizobium sp.]